MAALRPILQREGGHASGPIRRLISPEALGEQLKPFIFLDFFDAEIEPGFGFGMHPHSGIATLTWQPGTDVAYEDTTGQVGVLQAGGLEWMNAGGGAWHRAQLLGRGRATGFQLWVAMPPVVEDAEAFGQYVAPDQVPRLAIAGGELLVLLGEVRASEVRIASPIESHQDMTYLVVKLDAGAAWRYSPPPGHDVAWAFAFEGEALVQGEPAGRDLLVLGAPGDIQIQAGILPVKVVVGTAARHRHPLVMGPSSVHTQRASLDAAHRRIRAIGDRLRKASRAG
jgi:redox-sensitive bicupin YhaK (pirin superfamily)